ncbi:hypothetical protein BJV82DRAFT_631491 [Fennellomyces sp. T-0311]|nr:hypothetical protein BJV82DRAFT_631491 [Fennellomyces sp. T-0311]
MVVTVVVTVVVAVMSAAVVCTSARRAATRQARGRCGKGLYLNARHSWKTLKRQNLGSLWSIIRHGTMQSWSTFDIGSCKAVNILHSSIDAPVGT